ncbi:hypothetical protein I6A60_19040 [Frankia sp. AgB1.9]|uniref:hypothetical protein n=1 Tax=unclassified Frankia TaxID=2632575 RepID=UPI00193252A6|nr:MULTISPECIES: hypothetical protein [unclassified Frankia]MBL7487892.1 hypothetical protein [Frankia sp. AgW1.1]MBL7549957.1 hypothetical protein [Frankia sp. AgB1.9]MBL7621464.1 hypothetical protein [Frankia sp. AgB1.8]
MPGPGAADEPDEASHQQPHGRARPGDLAAARSGMGLHEAGMWVDGASFPVCVQVPAGWWRLYRQTGPEGDGELYVAELVVGSVGPGSARQPSFRTRQPSVWRLEEELGWSVPLSCHVAIEEAPPWVADGEHPFSMVHPPVKGMPTFLGSREPVPLDPHADAERFWPWRASIVLRAYQPPTTYGRLGHAESPIRSWPHGQTRVEVVTSWRLAEGAGHRVAYRVRDGDQVVFAGSDVHLHNGDSATSRVAVQAVVAAVTGRPERSLSRRQHRFLDAQGGELTAAARPADDPYAAGTRIAVDHPERDWYTTGTVRAGTVSPTGVRIYRWRPDVADLPGHPWRDDPNRVLETPWYRASATLEGPDRNTESPYGELVLATGALVATVDDPRFAVGTVLRTFIADGPPRYEIRPHDAVLAPVTLNATEVIPLAGTAWASVDDLLLARALADLELRPDELLFTVGDCALVIDGPYGPYVHARYALPSASDPALAPDQRLASAVEAPPADGPTAGLPVAQLRLVDGVRHLRHPTLGHLAVPEQLFIAALLVRPDQLGTVLDRYRWLPAGPWPHLVAATLAALHAPADVAALTTAGPDLGQPPSTGPPATGPPPPRAEPPSLEGP